MAAYKHCEVLLHGGLLRKPQAGVAAAIHDSLNNHIVHLIRTPQVCVLCCVMLFVERMSVRERRPHSECRSHLFSEGPLTHTFMCLSLTLSQVSAALDARCSDVVLSGIVSRMYKQVLECCSGDRRPVTHHQTDLPAEQYHNAAAQNNFRMPLVLT